MESSLQQPRIQRYMENRAPRAYPSWRVIAEYTHGSPLQSATMVVGVREKSGSEGCFRIWVPASDFAFLLLLSRWHSFTTKWDKPCLVALDFLSAPVLLTVLCSLIALLPRLQWLLKFHMPAFFSASFPTYWENSFSPFDIGFTQLSSGGGKLLTYWPCSLPPFLPESLAKFLLISEKPKISAWFYLMTKRNFLRSWSQGWLHITIFFKGLRQI